MNQADAINHNIAVILSGDSLKIIISRLPSIISDIPVLINIPRKKPYLSGGGYVLIFGCAAGDVGIAAILMVSEGGNEEW